MKRGERIDSYDSRESEVDLGRLLLGDLLGLGGLLGLGRLGLRRLLRGLLRGLLGGLLGLQRRGGLCVRL